MGAIKDYNINRINEGPKRNSILGREVECLVNTGAPINVIDEATWNQLEPKPKLDTCKTQFFPYGENIATLIPVIAQFTTRIQYKNKDCVAGFVVIRGREVCLMSYNTAIALVIVRMDDDKKLYRLSGSHSPSPDETTKANVADQVRDILEL